MSFRAQLVRLQLFMILTVMFEYDFKDTGFPCGGAAAFPGLVTFMLFTLYLLDILPSPFCQIFSKCLGWFVMYNDTWSQ